MAQYRVYRTVHYAVTVEAPTEQAALDMVADYDEHVMDAIDEDEMTVELDYGE